MTFPLRSSSIAAYLECPRRAQNIYVERRWGRTVPAMALGTMAHAGIETLLRDKIRGQVPTLSAALEAAQVIPAHVDWTGAEDEQAPITERASAIVQTYAAEVAPHVEPIDVERRIEVEINGASVAGVLDVLEPTRIRDTKTTRRAPTPWGDPRHRFQLGLYAALVEHGCYDAQPRTAVIDYLVLSERKPRATKSNPDPQVERVVKYLPVIIGEDDLQAEKYSALATVQDVVERTRAGSYPRNPLACTSWGRPCEFLGECYPERLKAIEAVTKTEVKEEV